MCFSFFNPGSTLVSKIRVKTSLCYASKKKQPITETKQAIMKASGLAECSTTAPSFKLSDIVLSQTAALYFSIEQWDNCGIRVLIKVASKPSL